MRPPEEPVPLAPEERFRQVAAILAASVLRLRRRPPVAPDPGEHAAPKNLPDSSPNCLELPGETVLSVHTG